MLRPRLLLVLTAGILIGVGLSLTANVLAARHAEASASALPSMSWQDARLLAEVLQRVQADYVDPVDQHRLMEEAVRGMVASLDAHSMYLDKDEYADMQAETAGTYPGVGIEVSATANGVEVLRTMREAPAAEAGMRVGDVIVSIDGQGVESAKLDAAIDRLRGPVGSRVLIRVRREGHGEPLDFDLRRSQVTVHSVAGLMLEPGVGYLRIEEFTETTAAEVVRELHELARQSARPMVGLVLDLRDNPGGLLESAVQVADDFLDRGIIVTADGRASDARFRMDATPGDLLHGAPITVLVNGNSASAAEILAGALHDNARATLVGHRTYGKGSVQTIMPLSEGRALKLTTSRYFTPSGASINQVGIEPDVAVSEPDLPLADLDAGDAFVTHTHEDPQVRIALDTLHKRNSRTH